VTIDGSGQGKVIWRIGTMCDEGHPQPCDSFRGNELRTGGEAAFVLTAAWFAPELVVIVDHAVGSQATVGDQEFVKTEDGSWVQEPPGRKAAPAWMVQARVARRHD
jgi:hypothetical protein